MGDSGANLWTDGRLLDVSRKIPGIPLINTLETNECTLIKDGAKDDWKQASIAFRGVTGVKNKVKMMSQRRGCFLNLLFPEGQKSVFLVLKEALITQCPPEVQ